MWGFGFTMGFLWKTLKKVFINAQEGKTKSLRQWRFNALSEIEPETVLAYILEAIENEKAGLKLLPTKPSKPKLPELLEKALKEDKVFMAAFDKLTFGKQKEYAEHIASAKREQTQIERLEKIRPMIMEGIGLNDRYKKV
jgi:uncharacterized protein YdeI (YjbR/CyaY-like superfamily)